MHDKTIRRRRAVLALLVAISLILLTAYFGESPASPLHSVQRGIVAVLAPIQDGASRVLSPVRDIAGFVSSTVDAKSENARLKQQNQQLRADLDAAQYKLTLYPQLSRQQHLDTTESLSAYSPLTTNVIGKNPVLWYDQIELSAGSADGVREYDPVVGDGGLVGDVTQVGGDYSIVTLITSPKSAVDAMVLDGAGDSGILQPKVGNPQQLLLSYLPSGAGINYGDAVVTSGFRDSAEPSVHSLYPAGIPVGTVSNHDTQDTLVNSQQVSVAPVVDLQHLSVVQILTRPQAKTESASLP